MIFSKIILATMTFGIMKLVIVTFRIMASGILTNDPHHKTFNKMTLSIMIIDNHLSIQVNNAQRSDIRHYDTMTLCTATFSKIMLSKMTFIIMNLRQMTFSKIAPREI